MASISRRNAEEVNGGIAAAEVTGGSRMADARPRSSVSVTLAGATLGSADKDGSARSSAGGGAGWGTGGAGKPEGLAGATAGTSAVASTHRSTRRRLSSVTTGSGGAANGNAASAAVVPPPTAHTPATNPSRRILRLHEGWVTASIISSVRRVTLRRGAPRRDKGSFVLFVLRRAEQSTFLTDVRGVPNDAPEQPSQAALAERYRPSLL
jgi:hypothetical protein